MRTVVLVPFRGGDPHRERAWAFARAQWRLPVFVSDDGMTIGPFNKSRAVNRAAAAAGDWDVAVIADADMLVPHDQVRRCAQMVHRTGRAAHPFSLLHRLSAHGTDAILNGSATNWSQHAQSSHPKVPGGVIVVPRRLWDAVGGMDERFVGWGGEDGALKTSCRVLGDGIDQVDGEAWHLWHPPAPTRKAGTLYAANRALAHRYRAATTEPAIRALILERSGTVPRHLHQIWIGPRPMPETWRKRWIEMHPSWQHTLWNERAIRRLPLTNSRAFERFMGTRNWPGAADVARLEILLRHGGVFADIDSEPLRPLDRGAFMRSQFFAGFSNPVPDRPGRIANGVIGAIAGHPILAWAVAEISNLPSLKPAWDTVGGTLLTRAVQAHQGMTGVRIMPARTFYPESSKGIPAAGRSTPYTRHFWASTAHSQTKYAA